MLCERVYEREGRGRECVKECLREREKREREYEVEECLRERERLMYSR